MAIAFRSSSIASANEVASLTITKPAGTVADDLLLVKLSFVPDGAPPVITYPAGWTEIRKDGVTNGEIVQAVARKVAGASEPANYVFTWTTTSDVTGAMHAYSGEDTTTPIDVHGGQKNASSVSVTAPSVTTTVADTMLVGFFGLQGNTARTFTPPTGMTERTDGGTTGALGGIWAETADQPFVGPGATGTRVATCTVAGINIGQLVAIKPAAGAAPTQITVLDSGTVSEAVLLTAQLTVSDNATISETFLVTANLTVSDTAIVSEAFLITASLTVSDTGTIADAITTAVQVTVTVSDIGTVTDTIATAIQVTVTDAASITEAPSVPEVRLTITDSTNTAEVVTIPQIQVFMGESGTITETFQVQTTGPAEEAVAAGGRWPIILDLSEWFQAAATVSAKRIKASQVLGTVPARRQAFSGAYGKYRLRRKLKAEAVLKGSTKQDTGVVVEASIRKKRKRDT